MMDLLQALIPLIQFGFVCGVVIAVVIGAARVGWQLAPFVLIGAALFYLFG